MQLLAVALYNRSGQQRAVRFKPHKLNVLTGKSRTGKSAVLDIIDFCLGRNTVTLPIGVITQVTDWYAILVELADTRLVLARPNPESSSTNQAMITVGGQDLDLPQHAELRVNADTAALRAELGRRLGIANFRIEPAVGSLRYPYDVSVAQAALLCLQKQTELPSQEFLFHRQSERDVGQALRDTLPYFLGAAGPDLAMLRYELRTAQRALKRAERETLRREVAHFSDDLELRAIAQSAMAFGLLNKEAMLMSSEMLREELTRVANANSGTDSPSMPPELERRRQDLLSERREMRVELDDLEAQIDLLTSIQREGAGFERELEVQRGRLRSLNLIPATPANVSVCPLCLSELEEPDTSTEELTSLTSKLSDELERVERARPAQDRRLAEISEAASELRSRMRQNAISLDEIGLAESGIRDDLRVREQVAFLRGRIASALDRLEGPAGITTATVDLTRYQAAVLDLEEQISAADAEEEISSRLSLISQRMTEWAQRLELEHSEYSVRLDLRQMTTVADTPEGARPLRRIGSAENWIGYHLVAHLGLHWWFHQQNRPVPRFLMLDQPTQAFFPEEVQDAADIVDADWAAVHRQFELLRDFVDLTDGGVQIIVCDHANLSDAWFQDALVDNWRGGRALVPADWITDDRDQP